MTLMLPIVLALIAQAPPPPPPVPQPPSLAQHLRDTQAHVAAVQPTDVLSRRLLAEARTSVADARGAQARGDDRQADALAASADDLARAAAAEPPPDRPPLETLIERASALDTAIRGSAGGRARRIMQLAEGITAQARREAAVNDPKAAGDAVRADACMLAAAHVAIADDARMNDVVPHP